jgi:hypothetical protein
MTGSGIQEMPFAGYNFVPFGLTTELFDHGPTV